MKKIIFLLLIFFIFAPFFHQIMAASLKYDKTTVNVANGETFTISVIVDPSSDTVYSTDVYVNYDGSILKPTSVSAGSLFPTVSNDISTTGKIYIAGMVNDPANSVTTSGTLATITFQALKEATTTLTFDCSSSKIVKNDINGTNVINCSQNGTTSVTVGGGGTVPTTETITELPQSGIFENVTKLAIPGAMLLFLGTALRLLL